MGYGFPIRIQSMLSTATTDINGCLKEIQALDRAGCEMIRLTVPSKRDLAAIPEIRRLMQEEGVMRPLIADVHFSPQLAVDACEFFEKVRINPGNFSDRPKSSTEDVECCFEEGHEKLKEALVPLIRNLKRYQRAIRIGVNQGSLSKRMMERYGDSPQGMVASAMEMIELFEESDFDQLVVSLKSSNPITVQKAYRLLMEEQQGRDPVALHLGVTEAGNDIMGRIKSLVGIGVLLADGIGDTIRVSLTEPGPNEISFARLLISSITEAENRFEPVQGEWIRPLNHRRIQVKSLKVGAVVLGGDIGLRVGQEAGMNLPTCDYEFAADFNYRMEGKQVLLDGCLQPLKAVTANQSLAAGLESDVLLVESPTPLYDLRRMASSRELDSNRPLIGISVPARLSEDDLFWEIQLAGLLSEELLDFLLLPPEPGERLMNRLLCLLQATRVRLITTDYIICPSCGRTLFDIERTAETIKQHTNHLKGLKIGVMGCIVNGPGEMADADFGYVGSGKGKVDLYYGHSRVHRGIDENEAVEKLIELIKEKGKWREPAEKE